jgi:hypothetical protein
MKTYLLAAGLLALAARPAAACGVPNFGAIMADAVAALAGETEQVRTPLLVIGGGNTTDGDAYSLTAGYGWGERQHGGLFPGTSLTRILAGVRRDAHEATAISLTYGWYSNAIGSLGFDFGAETNGTEAGPIARLTIGLKGVSARLGAGFMFGGDETHASGQAELVVDVMDLVGHI